MSDLCPLSGVKRTYRKMETMSVTDPSRTWAGLFCCDAQHSDYVTAFEQRLRELGWIDGRTVAIAYRWAVEQSERYPVLAAEFSRLKVDVIVTAGNAVLATTHVTSVIPIVFAAATDPVGAG